ncbi:hypothetical protein Q7P37_010526 [Cladosporium fusiforme]
MLLSNLILLASSGAASVSAFSLPESLDVSALFKRKGGDSNEGSESGGGKGACPAYWQQISKDLNSAFLSNGQCNANARAAIRFAFHDAGTFSTKLPFTAPAGGGADGSLLLNPSEMKRGENGGLEDYFTFIQGKLSSYRSQFGTVVGAADLIQFASNVATITCPGGPKVKTFVGRTDSTNASPENIMPPGFGPGSDHDSLLQLFVDKGFNAAELAALLGAHSTSTAFKQAANGIPVGGAQDSTPGKWDINYYAETYKPPTNVYRFDSDINLANKTTTVGKQFSGFVGQTGKWQSAFANAMLKMSLLGIPSSAQSNFADCTNFLPAGTKAKMAAVALSTPPQFVNFTQTALFQLPSHLTNNTGGARRRRRKSRRQPLKMASDFDDEFGLSSSDELELLAMADKAEDNKPHNDRKHKRSESEVNTEPFSKMPKVSDTALDIATNVLNTKFKLPAFRLKQALAISRVLNGDSAVVVFPTGGGKSLCYQVPGVAIKHLDKANGTRQGFAEGGITLVVSPLIALMKDQVDALKRLGVRAESMDSSKSKEEYFSTVQAMREGNLDILYCAPERLNNEGFVASMASVKGGVRLLAVDEAHCISEWGHAFRPDYLKVARFAKEIQAERVICLTATATPKVTEDVCKAFDIPPNDGVFRTPTYRGNLKLQARSFLTKEESYPELLKFLKQHRGPTIVYVTLQKHAEHLSTRLKGGGMNSRHFHAGMPPDEKTACQDEFMSSNNMVICATIAFGMGIDKANIRNVIHYDIPRSLEGYSQEIGRAGRDGKESHCMLFLCAEDFHLRESFTRGDLPSKQSVRGMIQNVFSTMVSGEGKGKHIELNLFHVSKEWDIKAAVVKNIFAQLELRFGLVRETTPKYTTYQYKELSLPTDNSPAANAVRQLSKKAKVWTTIDLDKASQLRDVSRESVVSKLNDWNERGFIQLETKNVHQIYLVLKPLPSTLNDRRILADQVYAELEVREQQDLVRMDQVTDLVVAKQCFARSLANHFGDDLPDNAQECGHCTWCETHTPVELKKPPQVQWDAKAFAKILKDIPERDDARYLARIAFGISSPRATQAKLGKSPIFGSMEDCSFTTLLDAFTKVCGGD